MMQCSKYSIWGKGLINSIIHVIETYDTLFRYRRSDMSAHVLLNLLNELGKRDKM